MSWMRFDEQGLLSVALIGGRSLNMRVSGLDIVLNRPGNLCITREKSGGYRIYADLMNHPALQVELNQRKVELDPGQWRDIS